MVGLDQVGIVLGIETSRLARSCRDWYQLLEVCAVFRTLIGDADGVYDPGAYNDRLLLGLKGTMSEAELHVLKQRMQEGKNAKARRGELGMRVPMGYVRRPSGEIVKDPDEQAQAAILALFDTFKRVSTINGTLQRLHQQGVQMPIRVASGDGKGDLEWRRPNRVSISNVLHHPIYAGAYVFGRRRVDPRKKVPGQPSTGRVVAKQEDWEALIRDRLPAYISWEQYERNQKQLADNACRWPAPARNGSSLMSGLIVCGRCGRRMATQYTDNGKGLRYNCQRESIDYAGPHCQSLSGACLDSLVVDLVFEALKPSALELSLKVAEEIEHERRSFCAQWEKRIERSRYEAERAQRQYNAVEPENRLVARTLEKQWEDALSRHQALQREYEKETSRQSRVLTATEREVIHKLASDVPALWNAKTTTPPDRQAIVRQLIDRVVVSVRGESELVDVDVHWAGGHKTNHTMIRPVAHLEQLSTYKTLLKRTRSLHKKGNSPSEIADVLNKEKWRPPKRRDTFNGAMVAKILRLLGLRSSKQKPRADSADRRRNEWTLSELARTLDMPEVTLYKWLRSDKLAARRAKNGMWLVRAGKRELARLGAMRADSRSKSVKSA